MMSACLRKVEAHPERFARESSRAAVARVDRGSTAQATTRAAEQHELAKDLVCGMLVNKATELRSEHGW